MGVAAAVVPPILRLVNLLVIAFFLTVQGSTEHDIAPNLTLFPEIRPLEGALGVVNQKRVLKDITPSPESQPNGSNVPPSDALPPLLSALAPDMITGPLPPHSPGSPTPVVTTPLDASPPPLIFQRHVPALSPSVPTVPPAHDNPGSNLHSPPALPPFVPVPDPPTIRLVPTYSHITPAVTPSYGTPSPPFMPQYHPAPPLPMPPYSVSPSPLISQGHVPSSSPSIPVASPPDNIAPPPLLGQGNAQPMLRNSSRRKAPVRKPDVSAPAATPSNNLPQISPVMHPSKPITTPPVAHESNRSLNGASTPKPIVPVSVGSPMGLPRNSPVVNPIMPGKSPSASPGPDFSHASTPSPSVNWRKGAIPVAAPPDETSELPPPANHSESNGTFSAIPPSRHEALRHSTDAPVPSLSNHESPLNNESNSPASSPHQRHHEWNKSNASSPHRRHYGGNEGNGSAFAPSYPISPTSSKDQGPVVPPFLPTIGHTHYASPPISTSGSPTSGSPHPFTEPVTHVSPAHSPSPTAASGWTKMPVLSPKASPSGSSSKPKRPQPVRAFPPPPPNEDCSGTVCTEPYTNTPPGSPCGCVLPMQVGLRLSVALYTFFPLVSELAREIATGVFMKQSQVHIIGANAASQEPEKTIALVDLVPLGQRFDNTTAILTYQRFWHKEVVIKASLFGDYEVLYVRYQGLPPSPPIAPTGLGIIDEGPYSGNNDNARAIKPLGVDVRKRQHKDGLGGGLIAIIALSGSVALVLCSAVAWVFLFRNRDHDSQAAPPVQSLPTSAAKPSGTAGSMMGSGLSSASLSFGSSIATYTGSAKTFSTSDLERATNNFDASRILGEGGFGRVYSGILEDGTKVAVKVLKRDDQQGGREFLAEVEMLSRLHHRNLVKLIGICTEEGARSLVYELIPNGSVESHLHGVDKESAPLDWDARMKIALGAARGLAYLHEDSSPRVIHRDFKASNILLEHDFTPKVSDFGLARTAMDEASRHISTRVMGTFGYVAPEYAMTGHLLVKSDVYSYGVVLLELLSGRKPVDMSRPPGQENLVAWARPLLTNKEGLQTIVDPSLGPDVPFDSVAKVAAIASMCVQPEVSHRPFMGEVVQALKLVCNECDEAKEVRSRSSSQDISAEMESGVSTGSGQLPDPFQNQRLDPNYDSEPDVERGLAMSDLFGTSARYWRQASGSFKRCSSSGPLTAGKGRQLWQRLRGLTGGSVSEHGVVFSLWPGSH